MSGSGGLADRLVQAAAEAEFIQDWSLGVEPTDKSEAHGAWTAAACDTRALYLRSARRAVAAVLTLLAEAIEDRWSEVYPPEVFRRLSDDAVAAYHKAFTDAGLSVDRWSAHVLQYGYRGAASLVRSTAAEVRDEQ